jgi:Protein of unknown function (DUF3443)
LAGASEGEVRAIAPQGGRPFDGGEYIPSVEKRHAEVKATSFIDSGSNFNSFPDASIATCTATTIEVFYPASQLAFAALLQGQNGVEVIVKLQSREYRKLVD